MGEAFLVGGVRTPFGRYGGALAEVRPDDMLAHSLRSLMARHPSLGDDAIDEVVAGCANQAGEDNRNVARMATLLAGLPAHVPAMTVNRLCGSGLEAVACAARLTLSGEADLVLAGGVESMTRAPYILPKSARPWDRTVQAADSTLGWRLVNERMERLYGTDSMAETAQNVAVEYGIGRSDQDAFALRSQQRYAAAAARGHFADEIVPVEVESGTVERDEHPRDTSLERLAKLPAVVDGGNITAGNSSGINDGAAAVLVASGEAVAKHGLRPLARIRGYATAGVEPRVMGIGPVPATRKLLARTGLTLDDVDLFEVNEAFAAQVLAVVRQLGLPDDSERVNPNGGAIAIGHPLGASGTRLALTLARAMREQEARRGVVTMCVGVGQGVSLLLEAA
ncbi:MULTISPECIES: acetyl-CoA C-acyltransferase [Thermocrispum]|uniref:Probable acetyl-CoA acetyltransferase n=1 Tax=Thermocrispum agreste TaxID=37925 RepID=A0A2W4L679_9PSEU|nr:MULTISPECIES: acetyl-CoA C-acyltransferase [Thermocrispum]PZM96499.1 MAG: acetyl-CoA C-acyltransferase [Thermocrispum agreste]